MPERIQLSRQKGYKMPPNTVKVDRSTRWGNPFNKTQIGVAFFHHDLPAPIVALRDPPGLARCLDLYLAYLYGRLIDDREFLEPLRGKNLACWCKLGDPCHADTLLRLANEMNGT